MSNSFLIAFSSVAVTILLFRKSGPFEIFTKLRNYLSIVPSFQCELCTAIVISFILTPLQFYPFGIDILIFLSAITISMFMLLYFGFDILVNTQNQSIKPADAVYGAEFNDDDKQES